MVLLIPSLFSVIRPSYDPTYLLLSLGGQITEGFTLFVNKMGIHWYVWFAIKTGDNRDIFSKYNTFKDILNSIIKALIVLYVF